MLQLFPVLLQYRETSRSYSSIALLLMHDCIWKVTYRYLKVFWKRWTILYKVETAGISHSNGEVQSRILWSALHKKTSFPPKSQIRSLSIGYCCFMTSSMRVASLCAGVAGGHSSYSAKTYYPDTFIHQMAAAVRCSGSDVTSTVLPAVCTTVKLTGSCNGSSTAPACATGVVCHSLETGPGFFCNSCPAGMYGNGSFCRCK